MEPDKSSSDSCKAYSGEYTLNEKIKFFILLTLLAISLILLWYLNNNAQKILLG